MISVIKKTYIIRCFLQRAKDFRDVTDRLGVQIVQTVQSPNGFSLPGRLHHLRVASADRRGIENAEVRRHTAPKQAAALQAEDRHNHSQALRTGELRVAISAPISDVLQAHPTL